LFAKRLAVGIVATAQDQQAPRRIDDARRFNQHVERSFGVDEYVVNYDGIELIIRKRQRVHITLAQTAVRQARKHYASARETPRIGIDVNTEGAIGARCEQLENAPLAAADIQQVTEWRCDGQFNKRMMQRTVFVVLIRSRIQGDHASGCAQINDVSLEFRLVVRQQREQTPQLSRVSSLLGQAIKYKVAIAKALYQANIAQHLQVLRNTRLALAQDLSEFRHAALAVRAQHYQPQAHGVGERLELFDEVTTGWIH
jgi:hypothetical protein